MVFSSYWRYCTVIEFPTAKSFKPGMEKERFIVIELPSVARSSPYRDIVDKDLVIHPVTIGARQTESGLENSAILLLRAALLWSPLVSLIAKLEEINNHQNFKTDYVPDNFPTFFWVGGGAPTLHQIGQATINHLYISSPNNEFIPKYRYMCRGEPQISCMIIIRSLQKMLGEKRNTVKFLELKKAPHNNFGIGILVGRV
ncbi:hypothetical protein B0O99DRAFT_596938 [Bisporella sp. PMI_857]|nr:hypothetical protein B0O99DRAFT_596938 [Bisporella sp. PMI_857]